MSIAALLLAAAAPAALPTIQPWPGAYAPVDKDERGLWLQVDEAERELKTSRFVIEDPALNAYVQGVLCRAVGADRCGATRIYLMRTPYFNANMAPNGMMQVWSGLLLRINNEAELAAVLAHEFAHYEQRHTVQSFRQIKKKTDAMAWFSFVPYVGMALQIGALGSVFSHTREMEREADVRSLAFLTRAGYRPEDAANIWRQLREEADATALARKTRSRKDDNGGFFGTHPTSADRMTYLTELAATVKGGSYEGVAEYRAALTPWWPRLIDDQIKLNDFGGTEFLLAQRARDGWTPELLFARGELYRSRGRPEDLRAAAGYYREAIAAGTMLPETWRGLGLALLRTGSPVEGRAALREYLAKKPDAGDAAMMTMLTKEPA